MGINLLKCEQLQTYMYTCYDVQNNFFLKYHNLLCMEITYFTLTMSGTNSMADAWCMLQP